VRLGIADHFGWAVAVVATADHRVVDRRRVALVERDVTPAPIHYEGDNLDDDEMTLLLATVRDSVVRAASAAFDEIEAALAAPVVSISLRAWPPDFPTDLDVVRRSPYEARADGVMYRRILSDLAFARGWRVHLYDAKTVELQARDLLGERAHDVLHGPRAELGPPWAKDHRTALASTITVG